MNDYMKDAIRIKDEENNALRNEYVKRLLPEERLKYELHTLRLRCIPGAEKAFDLKMYGCLKIVPVNYKTGGRWIGYPQCLRYDGAYSDEDIVCSKCHAVWNIIENDAERFDYCPSCGCKMNGEE